MNLLITGAWHQALDYIPEIKKKHDVVFLQFEKDDLPCTPNWVEGVVGNGIFLYHPIEQFNNLKFIQLTSAGYDRVPMDYVNKHNISVFNARGVYSIPMAEYALSGVLSLYKNSKFFFEKQKTHLWEKDRSIKELFGRKICIFGCGSVGSECAKRFGAMGCEVIGIDPVVQDNPFFLRIFHPKDLNKVIGKTDIVIVTLPLTEETRQMINEEVFKAMKSGSILVNIARGALVNTSALIEALKTKLLGAVLDVFEEEPLQNNSVLWDEPNVIITPHNSFVGENNDLRLNNLIIYNLNSFDKLKPSEEKEFENENTCNFSKK